MSNKLMKTMKENSSLCVGYNFDTKKFITMATAENEEYVHPFVFTKNEYSESVDPLTGKTTSHIHVDLRTYELDVECTGYEAVDVVRALDIGLDGVTYTHRYLDPVIDSAFGVNHAWTTFGKGFRLHAFISLKTGLMYSITCDGGVIGCYHGLTDMDRLHEDVHKYSKSIAMMFSDGCSWAEYYQLINDVFSDDSIPKLNSDSGIMVMDDNSDKVAILMLATSRILFDDAGSIREDIMSLLNGAGFTVYDDTWSIITGKTSSTCGYISKNGCAFYFG